MMDLDLEPGLRAGPFSVGMPLRDALGVVQRDLAVAVPSAQVKYAHPKPKPKPQQQRKDDDDDNDDEILVDMPQNGVLLRFARGDQRLRAVEVYRVHRVRLRYAGFAFGCSRCGDAAAASALPADSPLALDAAAPAPTFVNIYRRLGPCFPGDFAPDFAAYTLRYPGLAFVFAVPPQHRDAYRAQATAGQREHPIEFPDGTSAVACRVVVSSAADAAENAAVRRGGYWEPVDATAGAGIAFSGRERVGVATLRLGMGTQDVVAVLGPPGAVFYKEEDKMRLILSSQHPQQQHSGFGGSGGGDVFYNYFSRGIDVLCGGDGTVRKIVLHTNHPHHRDFNTYAKCNFRMALGDERHTVVGPDSTWDEISAAYGGASAVGRPIVNAGGSSDNPFGPTFFYGFPGVIYEVLQNGDLVTVCIF